MYHMLVTLSEKVTEDLLSAQSDERERDTMVNLMEYDQAKAERRAQLQEKLEKMKEADESLRLIMGRSHGSSELAHLWMIFLVNCIIQDCGEYIRVM